MELEQEQFQKYFDEKISSARKLEHKGNNQLFEVVLDNGETFLLKKYSEIHMDNWERGKAEFKALKYLKDKGFREIPKAIKFDEYENIGIYTFEQGKPLQGKEVTEQDIVHAVNFLVKLHSLGKEDKEQFAPASSACLNLKEYVNVIDRRLNMIIDFKPENETEKKAREFLDKKLIPKIEELKKDFLKKAEEAGLDLEKELDIEGQVLTPADFGFHNILKNGNAYKFLDFEYFGRDDPARQILDFFHHAKSADIDTKLKQYFIDLYCEKRGLSEDCQEPPVKDWWHENATPRVVLDHYQNSTSVSNHSSKTSGILMFKKRLDLLDSLIAITWVLIYLNVLSKKQLEHIKFAQGNIDNIIEERLKNAEKKLDEIG